jgi:integrase
MQGKQAKMVSPTQEWALLGYLETTRYPAQDRVMFLLSLKAGLRAKAMGSLTWAMVTDAQGQVAEAMHVPNRASKGKTGGRTIPLHSDLQAALVVLQTWRGDAAGSDRPVVYSERGGGLSPATVRLWFHRLYTSLKMDGCSSHSGRRTFITLTARKVSQVGGSCVLSARFAAFVIKVGSCPEFVKWASTCFRLHRVLAAVGGPAWLAHTSGV